MKSYSDVFGNKNKVLFVTAHPDDVDGFFGGVIAKLAKDNKEVFVLVVTNGARGSRENQISEEELGRTRVEEQKKALEILGVKSENFFTLNFKDGEIDNNYKNIGEIAKFIRKLKPDIVATHEPNIHYYQYAGTDRFNVNHRDHRLVGSCTIDAVYPFSRDRSFFPEHYSDGLEPHTVRELYLVPDYQTNTQIDINDVVEQKRQAILAHKSQMNKEQCDNLIEPYKNESGYFEPGNHLVLEW